MLGKIGKALASFFIGTTIAAYLFPPMGHTRWHREANVVRRIANDLDLHSTFEGNRRIRSDPELIQQWLVDGLEPGDLYFPRHPGVDVWGNTYRLAPLQSDAGRNDDVHFGVFSLGEDGRSHSNGDDPDDINSWSEAPLAFYYRRMMLRQWVLFSTIGLLFAPFIWILLTDAPRWTIRVPKRWLPNVLAK